MGVRDTIDGALRIGEENAGTPYYMWTADSDFESVMHMNCSAIEWPLEWGNCTSVFNAIACALGNRPIGGTPAYGDPKNMVMWEKFDIRKNYPPGVFLLADYAGPALEDQGHIAMVATFEETPGGAQYMLQSDCYDGMNGLWGSPGLNSLRTMETSHRYSDFEWAGIVDGFWLLDEFPGFAGSQGRDRCLWAADVADYFGVPRFYPALAGLTENRPCWSPDSTLADIRDADGYMSPADHDSYGPLQMRFMYWPLPWSYTCSVVSFCNAISRAPGYGHEKPIDKWGAAECIQSVWKSGFSDGSNYAANYDEAVSIVAGEGSSPSPSPMPEKSVRSYQHRGWGELGVWHPGTTGFKRPYVDPHPEGLRLREWTDYDMVNPKTGEKV